MDNIKRGHNNFNNNFPQRRSTPGISIRRPIQSMPMRRPPFPGQNLHAPGAKFSVNKDSKKAPNKLLIIGGIILILIIILISIIILIARNSEEGVDKKQLDMKIESVKLEEDSAQVNLQIDPKEEEIVGIKFIFETEEDYEVFKQDVSISKITKKEFTFELKEIDGKKITRISVSPIFENKKGEEVLGSVEDDYFIEVEDNEENDSEEYYEDYNDSYYYPQEYSEDYYEYWDYETPSNQTQNNSTNQNNSSNQINNQTNYSNIDYPNQNASICGNNIVNPGEFCDSGNLAGETCVSLGYASGTLGCRKTCEFDTRYCTEKPPINNSPPSNNTPNPPANCVSYSYSQCYNGDIYWYNSCGVRGTIKEDCFSDETCTNNECVVKQTNPTCISNSYSQCYNGDIYWYNSCGVRGIMREDCTSSETCTNNACVINQQNIPTTAKIVNVYASSYEAGTTNIPRNTLDSNLDTRWASEGIGEWIKYELNQTAIVNNIQIAFYNGNQRIAYFSVETSLDNSTWTRVLNNAQGSGNTLNLQTFTFSNSQAKYIRIIGNGNSDNEWNSYNEVKINNFQINLPVQTCTSNSYSQCYNNDVYWYNSCNQIGSIRYDCSSTQTCSNNACVNNQPSTSISQLRVDSSGHYLIKEDGTPFFYLGDTAWRISNRLTREEVDSYLQKRKSQGFTVIMIAVGYDLSQSNAYGYYPYTNNNFNTPRVVTGSNNDYWDHLDYIINKAEELGLYVSIVPVWGNEYVSDGTVNEATARNIGKFYGERYKDKKNIIWIMGGDVTPNGKESLYRGMAEEITKAIIGSTSDSNKQVLITYHPTGWYEAQGYPHTSSVYLHNEAWLDMNGIQSGHYDASEPPLLNYKYVEIDYTKSPAKPTSEMESFYESHYFKNNVNYRQGNDYDIRRNAYWSVFAGAYGYTYGNNNIWPFYLTSMGENGYHSDTNWQTALDATGANDMIHLKNLMFSQGNLGYLRRIPDQSLILTSNPDSITKMYATRDSQGSYAFVYIPSSSKSITIDTSKISGNRISSKWYNPRDGTYSDIDEVSKPTQKTYTTPSSGPDWVLVITSVVGSSNPTTPSSNLPLKISSNSRYLTYQDGTPFLMTGDTAWSLIAQVSKADADYYLQSRKDNGFNTVLINLLEAKFADNAPANYYDVSPFTGKYFTTPNEVYFAHADYVINSAKEKGMIVLLAPIYLGWQCGDEGFCSEVQSASESDMLAWGRYVGNRYKDYNNIIWDIGGDTDPTTPVNVKIKTQRVAEGIKEIIPNALFTAHNSRGQMAIDPWSSSTWLNVNDVYTTDAALGQNSKRAYEVSPIKPFFLFEAYYESEHSITQQQLRAQKYITLLSGGFGNMFGNCPLWGFGTSTASSFCSSTNWKAQLTSTGTSGQIYAKELFESRAWHLLVPDFNHVFFKSGYGTLGQTDYAIGAKTSDSSTIIIYLPTQRTISVDTTVLSGSSVRSWWYNPSTGVSTDLGTSTESSSKSYNPPSSGDWVLVIDDSSKGFSAPGQ